MPPTNNPTVQPPTSSLPRCDESDKHHNNKTYSYCCLHHGDGNGHDQQEVTIRLRIVNPKQQQQQDYKYSVLATVQNMYTVSGYEVEQYYQHYREYILP